MPMSLELILIITVFLLITVIFFLLNKKWGSSDSGGLKLLQDQILHLSKTLDTKLWESNRSTMSNFKTTNKMTEDITKKLASLEETNKQIKDIWWQLEGLESILKNPKQRGILGEYFLESVLKNILPPENYKLQYGFKNGEVVDGAIFIKEKIIPIDSKFSLENYNKILDSTTKEQKAIFEKEFRNDLKKRIDETSKYIRPEENTMEFAFMFIPSEWIYYDLLVNKVGSMKVNTTDLIEYAFKEKKVIIVSPTSFYAYLQTVMQWLRALKIEEAAKDIQKQVEKLWRHLNSYEEYIQKLWGSLGTTVSHYNNAYKEFGKIDKDIVKITNAVQWGKVEVLSLEKPGEE